MSSDWRLADIDVKKSLIKLHKQGTKNGKIYFFPDLLEAKIKGKTLIAVCQDCSWVLDVETGVRRRLNGQASASQVLA